MSTYKVKSNLKHDGKEYVKGDTIELESDAAEALLKDRIVVDLNETVEDEEPVAPQPPVNNVKREGEDVEGEQKVEPGTVEKPQPGDQTDEGEGAGEGEDNASGEGNEGDNL